MRRFRLIGATAAVFVGFVATAVAPTNVWGAQTLCTWAQGFTWGYDAHGSINHYWSHRSTWRTWSNPNQYIGRRWYYDAVTYEFWAAYGNYWEFVNASNNWRSISMYVYEGPYNPERIGAMSIGPRSVVEWAR